MQIRSNHCTTISSYTLLTVLVSLSNALVLCLNHCNSCQPLQLMSTTATHVNYCNSCQPLQLMSTTAIHVNHCNSCLIGSINEFAQTTLGPNSEAKAIKKPKKSKYQHIMH